ncbi:MAG TPA: shikimate dehydrogenase [Flavobacterium sp.]|nr:shikimate dehydrogenase [Flavobacterium sp.]
MTPRVFGLIGRHIDYSFSRSYFSDKFSREGLDAFSYRNFDLGSVDEVENVFRTPLLSGLNVTIPYKEQIRSYLDALSDTAREIGAVNTIVLQDGKRIGHNTDYIGFLETLRPLLRPHHDRALILGTGGASKAVAYALSQLHIPYEVVSREGDLTYNQLSVSILREHRIIVNCTPLGTYPDIAACPPLPYEGFTSEHIAYDLIYNPAETAFLSKAKAQGAVIQNGYDMLVAQAEAAWQLWQSSF